MREKWEPILASYSIGLIPDKLDTLPSRDFRTFVRLWNHYQHSLRGEPRKHLALLLRSLKLDRYLLRNLKSWNLRKKLESILAVGYLEMQEAELTLLKYAQSSNAFIALMAIRSLLIIDPNKHISYFIYEIKNHPKWPRALVGAMLREVGPPIISRVLTQNLLAATDLEKVILLPYIRLCLPEIAAPAIVQILVSSQNETVLELALTQLHFPMLDSATLAKLCKHSSPSVRRETSALLGRIGSEQDIQLLHKLTTDSVIEVRETAEDAILALNKFYAITAQSV